MPLFEIGLIVAGLMLLYAGAEGLVKGASSLALRLGITPIIVGLTVVAFGTSAPELVVGLFGTDDVAVGNILGSNVANLALILGASALIRPIEVKSRAVRRDLPIMVAATLIFMAVLANGTLARSDGIILLVAMAAYLGYTYFEARRDMLDVDDLVEGELDPDEVEETPHWWRNALFVVVGIAGLALGAKWMVDGSVAIAELMGVSQLVIAISIVAFGTSLPELATSLVAAYRDEADISVGNVIGSNIFNLLFVVGILAVVGDMAVSPDARHIDIWVVLAVTVGIWPLLRTGHAINRWEGGLLLVVYFGYVISLFLR